MKAYPITPKTEITRLTKRGVYDAVAIHAILDESMFCTIAFVRDGQPYQIPTGFVRVGEVIYIHGSVGSGYMRYLAENKGPVSVSVTLMDGLVLARAVFHHSVNYRSVTIFSEASKVTDDAEIDRALEAFTEKMCPGRWADARKPTEGEWKSTMIIALPILEASAKVRTGDPKDDDEDYSLDVWAGVVPMKTVFGDPIPDSRLKPGIQLPDYLKKKPE